MRLVCGLCLREIPEGCVSLASLKDDADRLVNRSEKARFMASKKLAMELLETILKRMGSLILSVDVFFDLIDGSIYDVLVSNFSLPSNEVRQMVFDVAYFLVKNFRSRMKVCDVVYSELLINYSCSSTTSI